MFAWCFKELGRCMHTQISMDSNWGLENSTSFLSLLTVPSQCQQQEAKWGKPMSCSCKLIVKSPSVSRSIWIHNVIIWLYPAPLGISAKYSLLLVFHFVFLVLWSTSDTSSLTSMKTWCSLWVIVGPENYESCQNVKKYIFHVALSLGKKRIVDQACSINKLSSVFCNYICSANIGIYWSSTIG